MDADFAIESARLSAQKVLQEASNAMLAQANELPKSVLSLLEQK
jgi:flagellin